ncbi:MAG: ATP-dependent Clp protease proteolytic subunit [uncultured Sulfurovum sp.]|uniref:ATP-dependent Clp protease proteolytic subunit n=1 Tax=uncultured Sulfurovum sp. TaxID=269237 RepID=A0A6S6TL17_9BACT|nr:MAG: ATP-dependent Clp protease proteolytic subunit [uncultured Sulfurovum sp.]
MNYKLSLVTLLLLNTLNASMDHSNSNENNTSKERSNEFSEDPETKALELKERKLSLNNTLKEEALKSKHAALLTKLQELKWEKELLSEEFALKELETKTSNYEVKVKYEKEIEALEYLARVETINDERANAKIEKEKQERELEISKLKSQIEVFENTKIREKYVNSKPVYLENPLTKENKLVISDRRISINGTIRKSMADEITKKINYFNNKDKKQPIFMVIDRSPGGSALAGYMILKAMKGSEAPIYVVLRGYAASMAAIIVTLADKSFAYAHSTILHHQPLSVAYGNLTEQEEQLKRLESWWIEFGGATADKMGITLDEFKAAMYKNSSNGDWQELAVNAQKLKWVNHIVDTIVDTSVLEEPKKKEPKKRSLLSLSNFEETVNEKGASVVYLPRLSPSDSYFLHNPSGYYQFR